ncbi:MAG: deaminase [Rhodoblastus sp.]|uniref:deaminase n=1 Tax=Rhodoblastus sp. TaxID=1962975 RepID=UPI003F99F29F
MAINTLVNSPLKERYETHISYGNQLRAQFGNDALAVTALSLILRKRLHLNLSDDERFSKTVFLIHQFKREEEIELFRSIYGNLFFQISVYSRRGARVDALSRKFAKSQHTAAAQAFRSDAESIIQRDENEIGVPNGQRVGKIFHGADLVVTLDGPASPSDQVTRFCDLLFSSNGISPTRMEYGLFLAKAAALRTLDLSRQVGAAIFSSTGEVISLGSNEVPKANGGTYWPYEKFDDREFRRGYDSNDDRKKALLSELINIIDPTASVESVLSQKRIRDSQFMDALEYGRIVHAEMSAISDAARLGRPLKDSTLICTTFPCHMCAKHIIASGITDVVFLEPYPKSLASELHCDSIEIEGGDRGQFKDYPSVTFNHFFGITPRRYRELFERGKRKNEDGQFVEFGSGEKIPIVDVKMPSYTTLEGFVLGRASEMLVAACELHDKETNGEGMCDQ